MPNLGDIAYQTVAGAIGTATHGTGLLLGNLATTIVGMEIVAGSGEILWCDEHTNPEVLAVARVGIGALGVVTKVTIQCVPAFNLHVQESVEPLDDLLDGFADHAAGNDHFEFFWVPGTRRAMVKRNNRTQRAANPESKPAYFMNKIVSENLAFGAICAVAKRWPTAGPEGGEGDQFGRRRAGVGGSQRSGVRLTSPREILRDGVRHPDRGAARGVPSGA